MTQSADNLQENRNLNPLPQNGTYISATERSKDNEAAGSRSKLIVILLICILAVNAAMLFLQIYNPFTSRTGGFNMTSGGMPDFSQGERPNIPSTNSGQ